MSIDFDYFTKFCHFSVIHNPHNGDIETVEEWVRVATDSHDDFISVEDREKCFKNNDVWCVQVYPEHWGSFIWVWGSDPIELMCWMRKELENNDTEIN